MVQEFMVENSRIEARELRSLWLRCPATFKKGRLVDDSIAHAYVQMIRNAEDSIYIENQYFMGSAYAWLSENDTNCRHTIPAELVQKIVDKIHLGQRFVAYIVIPMFPEGDPTSAPIQVSFEVFFTPL